MSILPAVARVGVAAGWHASPSTSAPAVAHLMPTSWAADGKKTRPALCGQRRMRWLSAAVVDRKLRACDSCLAIAEQKPAIGATVRIAPSAPRADELAGRISDPVLPSTAVERLARRCRFRDELVQLGERALDYLDGELHRLQTRHLDLAPAGRPEVLDEHLVEDQAPAVEDLADIDEQRHGTHRPLAYSTSS